MTNNTKGNPWVTLVMIALVATLFGLVGLEAWQHMKPAPTKETTARPAAQHGRQAPKKAGSKIDATNGLGYFAN